MILAWLLATLPALGADGERDALWDAFDLLRARPMADSERAVQQARLLAATEDLEDGPRTELLRLSLASLSGAEVAASAARLGALEPLPFGARELWYLVDLLPEGTARSGLVLQALDVTPTLERWQLLLAWNIGVDDARALRLEEGALPIQRSLYARYPAEWSALDLALTLRKLDRRDEVDPLFEEVLGATTTASAALWAQRGIAAAGFGNEVLARDYLGRALALGSDDAAVVLARMDLADGRQAAARAGFRASILNLPPPDWSWRGWGTTLLPGSFEPPVLVGSPSPSTPPTNR